MDISKKRGIVKTLLEKMGLFLTQEEVEEDKEDEQITVEVVYEPDSVDAHGHWANKDEIRKACERFNEGYDTGVVQENLFHSENTDKFVILKSWIHEEVDVIAKDSGEEIKAGTWLAKIQYVDDKLWQYKKQGLIKGVSIGGAMANIDPDTGELTDITFNQEDLDDDQS